MAHRSDHTWEETVVPTHQNPILVAAKAAPVAHERVDGVVVARLNGSTGSVAGDIARRFAVTVVSSAATPADLEMAEQHPGGMSVQSASGHPVRLRLVQHAPETLSADNYGYVTELLWHSMHTLWDGPTEPTFDDRARRAWAALEVLDADIAAALHESAGSQGGAVYLVQDYQLALVPRQLREVDPTARILYFHHIAWPSPDGLSVLPSDIVADIMNGVLAADVVAFFAHRWRRQFLRTVSDLVPDAVVDHDAATVGYQGRTVKVVVEPLSYSPDALTALPRNLPDDVAAWAADRPLVVHAGRTDPIKNADRAVAAFEYASASGPAAESRMLIRMQPHRLGIAANDEYLTRVARAVARANARFGEERVRLLVGDDRTITIGCLARADVVMVNSVIDGQNLTAFECSVAGDRAPVLIISPTCGASEVLGADALTVNPFDIVEGAAAINAAIAMAPEERSARAARMRTIGQAIALPIWAARQLGLVDRDSATASSAP